MTDRELTFRRADPTDIDRLLAHVHGAYRGDASRKGWTTEADLLDGQRTDRRELDELIRSDYAQLWLIEREHNIVGSFVLKRERDAQAGTMHLGMIAVGPEQQGQGIGRALMQKAEQIVIEQRLGTRLEMTVITQRKELIAWYERRGFRVTGEMRPFPYGDQRFGLPRRADLQFCVMVKEFGG
jgi:ribosomal protein S18 acetylase RimI-like enzyme